MTTGDRTIRLWHILDAYRRQLDYDIGQTLLAARNTPRKDDSGDGTAGGAVERAGQGQATGLNYSLLGMKTEAIHRIDEALRRLADGEYGLCTNCSREISDTRLLALPFASHCRDCQEQADACALPATRDQRLHAAVRRARPSASRRLPRERAGKGKDRQGRTPPPEPPPEPVNDVVAPAAL